MTAQATATEKKEGLRERHVSQAVRESDSSGESVGQATPTEKDEEATVEKEKKTFGRTPDGTGMSLNFD